MSFKLFAQRNKEKELKKEIQKRMKDVNEQSIDAFHAVQQAIKDQVTDIELDVAMNNFVQYMWEVSSLKRKAQKKEDIDPKYAFNELDKSMQDLFKQKKMHASGVIGPRFKSSWDRIKDKIITGKIKLSKMEE